ncbi:hypothetical protein [Psychrobacillus psychrodurans]|uniref:hypothetical protein n=1 Tax=Psychrobacillus psychrodurans TaxID=126157 RepID=UPI0008EB273B|nr:hypothetical protein [Psychrobacillus psychrodurans]MCZ8542238.1 hypothetical protein [Psychrobacillus psychrodurans]SFN27724.1 hypothetical protein SAMN05421832_13113 [Psychrobacillus psychrodurans]
MGKTVTFSFSTKDKDSRVVERFTFEKLGIDEGMDDKAEKKVIDELFQRWVWHKLNISYSIVIEEE